jgi:leader peptidase (prepilin peptidase)/N-methyltransferase
MLAQAPPGVGVLVVLIAALIAGLAPQGLLHPDHADGWPWRPGIGLSALAAAAGLAAFGASLALGRPQVAAPLGVVAAGLAAMLVVDARRLLIPDVHVLLLLSLAIAWPEPMTWPQVALGAVVGGGLLYAVRFFFHRLRGVEGLGLGDVKLMAAIGALAGPERVLWIIVAGAVLGAAWLLVARRRGQGGAGMAPFGAAVALPAFVFIALDRLAA